MMRQRDYLRGKASKTGSKYLRRAFQHLCTESGIYSKKIEVWLLHKKTEDNKDNLRNMWKVLKRVINRKVKCNMVHKITVNDTEITNKQEISDEMNEYFAWIGSNLTELVLLRKLIIFKSPRGTQGHGGNLEMAKFFGRKIPNAIFPFSCNFNHNSPGNKYFDAKRVQTVWTIQFVSGKKIKESELKIRSQRLIVHWILIKYCKERW